MKEMTDIDKGWLAGIIDGEGCLYIHKSKAPKTAIHTHKYHPEMQVVGTDPHIIQRCLDITGLGRVHIRVRGHNTPQYAWQTGGNMLRELLPVIKPYMCKEDQADVILEALSMLKHRGRKPTGYGSNPRPQWVSERLEELYQLLKDMHWRYMNASDGCNYTKNQYIQYGTKELAR